MEWADRCVEKLGHAEVRISPHAVTWRLVRHARNHVPIDESNEQREGRLHQLNIQSSLRISREGAAGRQRERVPL